MEGLTHNIAIMVFIPVVLIGIILWLCKTMNFTAIPRNLHTNHMNNSINKKYFEKQFTWEDKAKKHDKTK